MPIGIVAVKVFFRSNPRKLQKECNAVPAFEACITVAQSLDKVLHGIVNNTWDIKQALAERNLKRQLAVLDDSLNDELMRYKPDQFRPGYQGNTDSALLLIEDIVRNEPGLRCAPFIAAHTFSSLLQTNQRKAYEYGKEALVTATYEDPSYQVIINSIEWYADKFSIATEIYELGAEAYKVKINHIPYPELVDLSRLYNKMADMYGRAKNKLKAVEAMQKLLRR